VVRRWLPALLTLLTCSVACGPRSPEATVQSAIAEAQAGRTEAFLDHFEPATRARLALYRAVSTHYGYIEDETFSRLSDMTIEGTEVSGDEATVSVSQEGRHGALTLVLVDGQWRIKLPRIAEATP
jgi:hypothetical protein